ncbi:MAG: hypothetical protein EPN91_07545 [Salinibacterium sp.]|nr:MAG: hypothetical protein EPN91_07545 [Salinibacterium sp.]
MSTSAGRIQIDFTNLDLLSKEGWATFLNERKERARQLSKKKDPGFADTILVLTKDPETGGPPSRGAYLLAHYLTIFNSVDDNDTEIERQKDGYAITMRSVGLVGEAFASVWRSEAWTSQMPANPDGSIPAFRVQPRLDLNRREVIMLMTDHRDFGKLGFGAIITPHPGKPWKRKIDPWMESGTTMSGRFASFIPSKEDLANPVMLWAAKEYLRRSNLEKLYEHRPVQGPVQ